MTTSSARPAVAQHGGLGLVRHHADGAPGTGPPGGGEAQRAGLAGAADDGHDGLLVAGRPRRWVSAGAPHTSITDSERSGSRSSGMTAAIERPNRTAYPSQGTCSDSPSQRASPSSITSGVRDSETSVATRSPHVQAERGLLPHLLDGADEHAAGAGLGVLHLAAGGDDRRAPRRAARRRRRRRRGVLALELAVRRRVEVELLHADPHLVGPQLAPRVEPLGRLGQHDPVVEDPVQPGRDRSAREVWAAYPSSCARPPCNSLFHRKSYGLVLDLQDVLRLLFHVRLMSHNRPAETFSARAIHPLEQT